MGISGLCMSAVFVFWLFFATIALPVDHNSRKLLPRQSSGQYMPGESESVDTNWLDFELNFVPIKMRLGMEHGEHVVQSEHELQSEHVDKEV